MPSQVIGLIETEANVSVTFLERTGARRPFVRSKRLGVFHSRRCECDTWLADKSAESDECVSADIDQLRADLHAELAQLLGRIDKYRND